MFEPKSLHEFSAALQNSSNNFTSLFQRFNQGETDLQPDLIKESTTGTNLLNTIAITIRNEMDYERIEVDNDALPLIGVFRKEIDLGFNIDLFKTSYSGNIPSLISGSNFHEMKFRDVLNKIAHFDRSQSTFYTLNQKHHLLLTGTDRTKTWFCVISMAKLVQALKELPDIQIKK